jgi:hypothetical protein
MRPLALLSRAAMSCALAGTLVLAGGANANTLQATGWMSVTTNPQPPETFDVHRPSITQNNVNTGGFAGIWNATESIFFWCFDLDHFFTLPGTYTNDYVQTTVGAYAPGDATLELQLEQLFAEAWPHVRDTRDTSAAFQLAIWNLLYDNDTSVSANQGSFWADDGSAAAITQANTWLAGLSGNGSGWTIRVLQSTSRDPRHQSFIVGDHPPTRELPEPSSLSMLMFAFFALALLSVRRRVQSRGGMK